MKLFSFITSVTTLFLTLTGAVQASDNGIPVDHSKYANRQVLNLQSFRSNDNEVLTLSRASVADKHMASGRSSGGMRG